MSATDHRPHQGFPIVLACLAGLAVFTRLDLLRAWAITTPRLVFPSRRIGSLEPGYEGSFLAQDC